MSLSNEQLPTFRAAIDAETDPVMLARLNSGDLHGVADWYNEPGTFVVWRTDLSEEEIVSNTSAEDTVWDWSLYISTSIAEKMAWERIFAGTGAINPSIDHVRAGIGEIFSGPQYTAQRTHLLAMAKRNATRVEGLFATGTGTTITPGKLVYEGFINYRNVQKALEL